MIYQLASCYLSKLVSCDKLFPTNKCLISAALRRRGKKESDQGPSDEVFCDQPTNHPSHLYSPFWTLSPPYTPLQWWTQIHCERWTTLIWDTKILIQAYLIVVSPQLECFGEVCPLKIVLFLSITMIWSDLIYLHQRKHILFLFRNSIFRPSRLHDSSKSTFDCKNGSQYTITFTQLNVRHHHLRCHGWWLL